MSLFDSSSKGVKFDAPGTSVSGTVKSAPRERQQTKFGTQEPDFWPNGDPKMQILIDLQTDRREDPNDDGERTLYVASKNMKRAIGDAIRASGANDVLPGGALTVTYTGNDPQSKNPANPAKLYTAQYTPPTSPLAQSAAPAGAVAPAPAPAASAPAYAPQTAPAAPAYAPQTAPAAAPASAAMTNGLTPDQLGKLAQLRAAGIDDNTIAAAIGATVDQVTGVPF